MSVEKKKSQQRHQTGSVSFAFYKHLPIDSFIFISIFFSFKNNPPMRNQIWVNYSDVTTYNKYDSHLGAYYITVRGDCAPNKPCNLDQIIKFDVNVTLYPGTQPTCSFQIRDIFHF